MNSVMILLTLGIGFFILVLMAVMLFAPRSIGTPPDWSNLPQTGKSAWWPPPEKSPYYDPETEELIPHTKAQAREYAALCAQYLTGSYDAYGRLRMSKWEFEGKKAFMLQRWEEEDAYTGKEARP